METLHPFTLVPSTPDPPSKKTAPCLRALPSSRKPSIRINIARRAGFVFVRPRAFVLLLKGVSLDAVENWSVGPTLGLRNYSIASMLDGPGTALFVGLGGLSLRFPTWYD